MTRRLTKVIDTFPIVEHFDSQKEITIPRPSNLFYQDFGLLPHPYLKNKDGTAQPIKELTPYQQEAWDCKTNLLAVKPNKIGLTTSFLLEDFQKCLLPETAGGEILVGAQDDAFANDHISYLKMLIKGSKKYSQFLIENPQHELLREMKSKVSVAFIRNPYEPSMPSKIIGIGQNPARTYSWKNVKHIHLSDISLMIRKDWRAYWRGIISRVANTRGLIKIESVPGWGQLGLVWQLYKLLAVGSTIAETEDEKDTFIEDPENMMPTFKLMQINVREAIQSRVITQEYLDDALKNLGSLQYQAAFGGKFLTPGNQWYKENWFTTGGFGLQ